MERIHIRLKAFLLTLIFFNVVACAHAEPKYNEGAIDYRRYDPDSKLLSPKYIESNSLTEDQDKLVREGDSISVKLLHAYICDFAEWDKNVKNFVTDRSVPEKDRCNTSPNASIEKYTKGEIAILASVFEQGSGQKIEFSKDGGDRDSMRVVYYSQDVNESGQPLNLSNMPIYGPITYTGNPLYAEFAIMELDEEEAGQLNSLVSVLATLGKEAYPPASPVLSTLEKISGALIGTNKDDIEFGYRMSFDGEGATSDSVAPLLYGDYAFVRHWSRNSEINWKELKYDPKTGRITLQCKSNDKRRSCLASDGKTVDTNLTKELRHYTYLTVRIIRNEKSIEQDSAQTFAEFRALPDEQLFSEESLSGSLTALGNKIESDRFYDDMRSRVNGLKNWPPETAMEGAELDRFINDLCLAIESEEKLNNKRTSYLVARFADSLKVYDPSKRISGKPKPAEQKKSIEAEEEKLETAENQTTSKAVSADIEVSKGTQTAVDEESNDKKLANKKNVAAPTSKARSRVIPTTSANLGSFTSACSSEDRTMGSFIEALSAGSSSPAAESVEETKAS